MPNLFAQFKALIPQPPLQAGTVVAVIDDIATVQLPGGGTIQARGNAQANDTVFVRDNVIEGTAPSLPIELINV